MVARLLASFHYNAIQKMKALKPPDLFEFSSKIKVQPEAGQVKNSI